MVYGDAETNRLVTSAFSGIYRLHEEDMDPVDTNRPIMTITASSDAQLAPGTYWLDWVMDGTEDNGPWQPLVTILGETSTGNALVRTLEGAWVDANDGGSETPQGFPFLLTGMCTSPDA